MKEKSNVTQPNASRRMPNLTEAVTDLRLSVSQMLVSAGIESEWLDGPDGPDEPESAEHKNPTVICLFNLERTLRTCTYQVELAAHHFSQLRELIEG
jgi:hypothetical protein